MKKLFILLGTLFLLSVGILEIVAEMSERSLRAFPFFLCRFHALA